MADCDNVRPCLALLLLPCDAIPNVDMLALISKLSRERTKITL